MSSHSLWCCLFCSPSQRPRAGRNSVPFPGDGSPPGPGPAWASKTGFLLQGGVPDSGGASGPHPHNPRGFWCCLKVNFLAGDEVDGGDDKSMWPAWAAELFLKRGESFSQNQRRGAGIILHIFQTAFYWTHVLTMRIELAASIEDEAPSLLNL